MPFIHPTAVIHPEAEVSEGVTIGPYTVLGSRVRVGKGTQIGPHVVMDGPASIGENCRIFPYASLGQVPQDLKFHGEESELIIGNNNVIREFVTFHRGTQGGGKKTVIGHNNFFMAYTHVAHDCSIGDFVIMGNAATLAGHVLIEDYSNIGAFSGIHQFCRVGKYGFVGGYSVITKDVLPYSKTVGNRARCYGMNILGLRRMGFDAESLAVIKQVFRLLLQSKLNTRQALEAISRDVPRTKEVEYLVNFIKSSSRGIIK